MDLELTLPKKNSFILKAKERYASARRSYEYAKQEACKHYYLLGNCIYEQQSYADDFQLTNGTVESSYSEQQLVSLGAIKHYYE